MNSEQLTPSQETGAVSTDCGSSPLGKVGPTELEAPPKGHAVPQQAPLTVRSGSQLSVDSTRSSCARSCAQTLSPRPECTQWNSITIIVTIIVIIIFILVEGMSDIFNQEFRAVCLGTIGAIGACFVKGIRAVTNI